MLPYNVGLADTLRKFLALSQTLYQCPAFAQCRDMADARSCCRPVLLLTNPR